MCRADNCRSNARLWSHAENANGLGATIQGGPSRLGPGFGQLWFTSYSHLAQVLCPFAYLPSAQAELGRQRNISNQIQPNPCQTRDESPCSFMTIAHLQKCINGMKADFLAIVQCSRIFRRTGTKPNPIIKLTLNKDQVNLAQTAIELPNCGERGLRNSIDLQ